MDVTKSYELIKFGAMDVTGPSTVKTCCLPPPRHVGYMIVIGVDQRFVMDPLADLSKPMKTLLKPF